MTGHPVPHFFLKEDSPNDALPRESADSAGKMLAARCGIPLLRDSGCTTGFAGLNRAEAMPLIRLAKQQGVAARPLLVQEVSNQEDPAKA